MKLEKNSTIRAWLELVRPPNLFTVPGDVFSGALLAGLTAGKIFLLIPAVFSSLLLYMAGLILNDYFDSEEDRQERPFRPIPSGRVKPFQALMTALGLILLALITAILIKTAILKITFLLVFLIIIYNGFARKVPVIGFIVMGLCRGVNILLGASLISLSFNTPVLIAMSVEILYVIVLTAFAFNEVKENCALLIGKFVRGLIVLQLIFIAVACIVNRQSGLLYLSAVIIMFVLLYYSRRTAKSFYGS